MRITVKLHGILHEYLPPESSDKVFELTLEEGSTLSNLVEQLGIPEEVLFLAFLDKQQVTLDTVLQDNGILWLFPPIAGG